MTLRELLDQEVNLNDNSNLSTGNINSNVDASVNTNTGASTGIYNVGNSNQNNPQSPLEVSGLAQQIISQAQTQPEVTQLIEQFNTLQQQNQQLQESVTTLQSSLANAQQANLQLAMGYKQQQTMGNEVLSFEDWLTKQPYFPKFEKEG